MQKIFLTGYVGRPPEERFTAGGKKVTSFPVGVTVTKQGEKLAVWYKIVCWGDQSAGILPHIKKGSCVTVVGDMNPPSTYQNKKGDIAIDMSVRCQSIDFAPTMTREKKADDHSVFELGEKE